MLFYNNLENIVFTKNQLVTCDELVVISGYVGPTPVSRLKELPIKSTVIYGMYGADGIGAKLHNTLIQQSHELTNTEIRYAITPVHAKCYIWRNNGTVVASLIGSANFSKNGLTTPFKEVLAESSIDTFSPLNDYIKLVLEQSIPCAEAVVSERNRTSVESIVDAFVREDGIAPIPLFVVENGVKKVPERSGLNWGMAALTGSHVNINDAYIPIKSEWIDEFSDMFPCKQKEPSNTSTGRRGRHNDAIEILWDDGITMVGLLEGTLPKLNKNGLKVNYPKQIASHPSKALLGKYIRNRLGVDEGVSIKYDDLKKYGRDTIDISLQGEGIYYFDFSV